MPYETVKEAKDAGFPVIVGDVGLTLAQINHLAKIYDVVKESGTLDEPIAVATAEWKEQYRKEGDKWVKLSSMTNKDGSSDAILQTLDRWLNGKFYTRSAFDNVSDWEGIKLVFGKTHPDLRMFMESPEEAAAAVGGRIVGDVSNVRINTMGHPRLVGSLNYTDDEVESMNQGGKLSLSTGLFGKLDRNNCIVSDVVPNHILLFVEDAMTQPGDLGAAILNTADTTDTNTSTTEGGITIMETTEIKESIVTGFEGLKKDLTALFEKKPPEGGGVDMTELTDMTVKFEAAEKKSVETATELTTLKTEFEQTKTEIVAKDDEIADLKTKATEFETATTTEITALKETVAKFEAAETATLEAKKTEQFEAMLNSVPLGQKDTDDKKTALRTEFDTDPTALALKVMAFEKMPATGEEGTGFEGEGSGTETGGVGVYNPITQTFEKVGA